ncbi:uncharacterized protein LOC142525667 isoform X4 [Primulina tabacum]|uniref:uncharacterized protein LOC142525667 isoform X4 n=1 Tax=Primulina tabacum TaxID=48773 RepID=UPI003F5957BA
MSSSVAEEVEVPDLVCELDCAQGVVDVLTSIRWKRHQDAVVEISEHGIVIIVEETACLQAKVYLQREAPALKEAIDDLEWSGSNIQINLMSSPQSVAFRGEGLGDLQT